MADVIVPEGMQRMWDPKEKKVILVSAPPNNGPDVLSLTVRLHDPRERTNAKRSAWWGAIKIPRADLDLTAAEFSAKHLAPLMDEIKNALAAK